MAPAPARALARQGRHRRRDGALPVRHAAAGAAAAAAAAVGAQLADAEPRLDARRRGGGVVHRALRVRHLPAQHRLAAQARHRGDPRSLRADDRAEEGRGAQAGRRARREERDEKKEAKKDKGDAKPKAPPKPRDPEAEARAAAERRARLAADVQKMGVLKILGAKGENGSVADLVKGGDVSGDADKVFAQVGGVGVATTGGGLRSKGAGGSGSLRGGGSLRASGPGEVGTGERGGERAVKGIVKDSAPHGRRRLARSERDRARDPRASRRDQGVLRGGPQAQPEHRRQAAAALRDLDGRQGDLGGDRERHHARRGGRELHQDARDDVAFPGARRRQRPVLLSRSSSKRQSSNNPHWLRCR